MRATHLALSYFARLSNPRSTGKAGGNWGREAEGWKKEIREEEGEGKEEEMDERHVHQCLDAHSERARENGRGDGGELGGQGRLGGTKTRMKKQNQTIELSWWN
jgi:hypothetical protein